MDEVAASAPVDDVIVLEQLDKHEGVIARHRFDRLPVTLGSAYESDHIIDAEPSRDQRRVAATVTRSAEGELVIQARDDAPDFWVADARKRYWRVNPDQSFVLGGQRFRVRTRQYVPSVRQPVTALLPMLGRWAFAWTPPLAVAAAAATTWLGDIEGERASSYLSNAFLLLAMLAMWSGLWALLSRLNGRSSHFLEHFSIASLAVATLLVLDYSFDSAAFAFSLPAIQRYDYALVGVVIGGLVWCHARLVTRLQAGTSLVSALAIGGALFAFQALTAYTARGNLASTHTLTELRPPPLRMARAVSTDEFFAGSESLKAKTEATRPEKPDGFDAGTGNDD